MRTSKRDRIITGALELAHRDGFDALTFDTLAEHVGLSRGGVIYHFRTKTELLEGIAAAFLERWRTQALAALGGPLEETSRTERIEALTRSVLDGEILPGEVSWPWTDGGPTAPSTAVAVTPMSPPSPSSSCPWLAVRTLADGSDRVP